MEYGSGTLWCQAWWLRFVPDSHTGCVWSLLGALSATGHCLHPLCPSLCRNLLLGQRRQWGIRDDDEETQRAGHRADFVYTAFAGLALQTHWSFTRKFFERLPFVTSSHWEGSRWETVTTWASLGLLEDRALALALLLVRSKGRPREELGVWSRAVRYLGNEVLPNWIRKFHQVA